MSTLNTPNMDKNKKQVVKWNRTRRINFPTHTTDPLRAIEEVESRYELPKHRVVGFEIRHYKGKWAFWTTPEVFIEK